MEIGWWMLRDGAIGIGVIAGLFFIFRIIFYRLSKNRLEKGKDPARIRAIFSLLILFWLSFGFIMAAFGGFGLYLIWFALVASALVFLIIITPDKLLYYPIAIIAAIDISQTLIAVFRGYFNLLDLLTGVARIALLVIAMLLNHRALKKGLVRAWRKATVNILRGITTVLAVAALVFAVIDAVLQR